MLIRLSSVILDFKKRQGNLRMMVSTQNKDHSKHNERNLFLTKEKLEEIIDWTKALSKLAEDESCTIIVEGQKDMNSLKSLGVKANYESVREIIQSLKKGLQDEFNGHSYVILTDFDKEGKLLHLHLKTMLTSLGAKIIEWPRIRYLKIGLPPKIEEAYNFVIERRNK